MGCNHSSMFWIPGSGYEVFISFTVSGISISNCNEFSWRRIWFTQGCPRLIPTEWAGLVIYSNCIYVIEIRWFGHFLFNDIFNLVVLKLGYSEQIRLTHWGRYKMADIFQTTFSNAFSWMKMFEFRIQCDWSVFLRVQLTIIQHWFR